MATGTGRLATPKSHGSAASTVYVDALLLIATNTVDRIYDFEAQPTSLTMIATASTLTFGQKVTREKTGARPDIEQVPRPEGPDHAAQRGRLGAVVPVPADIGAEDVFFLEIHQAFGPPSAPFS